MKILILTLIIFTNLSANFIDKFQILKDVDNNLTLKDVVNSNQFKTTTIPFFRKNKYNYFLHIKLNRDYFKKNETYILEAKTNLSKIVSDKKSAIKYRNLNFELKYPLKNESIYLKLENIYLESDFNVEIYKKDKFIEKIFNEKLFFGIGYGIILTAMLYHLAMFFYNRQKSYIYYSIFQLMNLIILSNWNNQDSTTESIFISNLIISLFFIFATLFTKSFLNTKKYTPKIDKILNLYIVIFPLDILFFQLFHFYILNEFLPPSVVMILFLISAFKRYENSFKPALFYLIGWGVFISAFLIIELNYYLNINFDLNPIYILQIVAPFEALVLGFALSYKMKVLEDEKNSQKEMLMHQSKMAQMGQMIGNIAHQWRQPLTHLSYIFINLKSSFKHKELDEIYLNKKIKEANLQLNFMSKTINDFKDFYSPNREKKEFLIKNAIKNAIEITSESLKFYQIELILNIEKDIKFFGYQNEFSQVILTLLSNAKDALIQIENPKIEINLFQKENKTYIEIVDNAKKIDKKIRDKIFNPYFSTKKSGMGLGLYISKMIIEKSMNGEIELIEDRDIKKFSISFSI